MALQLTAAFGNLSLGSRQVSNAFKPSSSLKFGFSTAMRGQKLVATRPSTVTLASPVFEVVAKQNSLKRQRVAEKARLRNKARKSAVRTRMRKVFVALDGLKAAMPSAEDELKPVEKLISEAYQEIDKAVCAGTLHKNTAARRKQRLAVAKRTLLIDAGLYKPVA